MRLHPHGPLYCIYWMQATASPWAIRGYTDNRCTNELTGRMRKFGSEARANRHTAGPSVRPRAEESRNSSQDPAKENTQGPGLSL